MLAAERLHSHRIAGRGHGASSSLRNLIHYLTLRRHDVRLLQEHLALLGLSSLGSAESHTLYTVESALHALGALTGRSEPWPSARGAPCFQDGTALLASHTFALLGSASPGIRVRIMVTLPSEAAHDPAFVLSLVAKGMNVARTHCAHAGPDAWAATAAAVREAARATGRSCLVQMDLGGPKLRTGPCHHEITLRERDFLFLTRDGAPGHPADLAGEGAPAQIACTLPQVLDDVQSGDRVFFDTRTGRTSRRSRDMPTSWPCRSRSGRRTSPRSRRSSGGSARRAGGWSSRSRRSEDSATFHARSWRRSAPGRMAARAECVMLNEGPHVLAAMKLLDGILRRMESHQDKKRHTMRPLAVSRALPD